MNIDAMNAGMIEEIAEVSGGNAHFTQVSAEQLAQQNIPSKLKMPRLLVSGGGSR